MKISALCAAALFLSLSLCSCKEDEQKLSESGQIDYRVISGNADSVFPVDENKYSFPVEGNYIVVPDKMKIRAGYNNLKEGEKEVYNLILTAMKNCDKSVKIPNIDRTGKDFSRILELIRIENPAMFHIDTRKIGETSIMSQTVEIEFTYKYTAYQVNTMLREAEKKADGILSKITSDMSEYDYVKLFHDELIINCKSDKSGLYCDNLYGALYDGKALCEGYSKAFSYLCSVAGIENMIVTGKTGKTDHMWNMVKLDGNWYHVDVTWDHPPAIITEAYPDAVLYTYFLVSDTGLSDERTVDRSLQEVPKATSSVMNYFYHDGLYADSYNDALNCIMNGCESAVSEKKHSFMIKLASDELYDTVLNGLFAGGGSDADISAAMREAGFTGKISCTNMFSDDRIIMFMLDY